MAVDSNAVVLAYLKSSADAAPVALRVKTGTRIYCPNLPQDFAIQPAVVLLTRGGDSTPYIPEILSPSKQFKCYGATAAKAREVYCLLYDCLQGIENEAVGANFLISAIEEVQGQDMIEPDSPQDKPWHYVLTFFSVICR